MKKLFPHIFVFLVFISLVTLGTWQVERRQWKQGLLAKIDSQTNAPPIGIRDYKNIDENEYAKMIVRGKFLHDKEILLLNKPYNSKQGAHVITPLLADNGEAILVDRGWMPVDQEPSRFKRKVEITGIVRAAQKLNWIGRAIVFDNQPKKQLWFWLDLPEMYKSLSLPAKDFYLDMINTDKSTSYPIALPQDLKLYNEHLQYAITWYCLSIALLIVYYFRFWRK